MEVLRARLTRPAAVLLGDDAADRRAVGPGGELTARAVEGGRSDRLALGAEGAGPDGAVHAIEGDETSASVAHRHADLDVQFLRPGDGCLDDPVRISECQ